MPDRPRFSWSISPILVALATIAAVALPAVTLAQQVIDGPLPDEEGGGVQRDRRYVAPARIVAHEWGVWVVENGRVEHLDELAAELPPFVFRSGGAGPYVPPPVRPPVPHPGPIPPHDVVARKPVLFLYSDAPVNVRVEVGFTGGEPWLFFPSAARSASGLVWDGQLAPTTNAAYAAPPRGHFWNDLRAVGATPFVGADGRAERFLFYDGPVAFERPFAVGMQSGGAAVTPLSTETNIFLADGGRYIESEIDPSMRHTHVVSEGDMSAFRARLETALERRGLSPKEARSLLDTWRDDLFTDLRRRAVSFVARDAYDRMLPLTITPAPAEIVRVGLVIERI